jgi:hypothetical protein
MIAPVDNRRRPPGGLQDVQQGRGRIIPDRMAGELRAGINRRLVIILETSAAALM